MKQKEQQITIWVTESEIPDNATFHRWDIWSHQSGGSLKQGVIIPAGSETNLSNLTPCFYHVRFSRWVLENVSIGEQGIQDGDIFVLVTQEKDKETVFNYMKITKSFPNNIPPEVAEHRHFITMQDVDEWLKNHKSNPSISAPGGTIIYQPEGTVTVTTHDELDVKSPWASGSFYLATFLVVIIGLGVLASSVPFYVLVIVLISAILFVPLIGALQLKQDKRLSEKKFMELIGMVIGQLPLIGKIAKGFGPRAD